MSADVSENRRVVVIGAGPGGYAAAFHAAELGLEVTLVNSDPQPGGVCLHHGCIPSKALLHMARLINEAREAKSWGLSFGDPQIDLDALRGWQDRLIQRLAGGVGELCRRRQVDLINARATFVDGRRLRLQRKSADSDPPAEVLQYERAILASGSLSVNPEIFNVDDPRVMNSAAALRLTEVPGSLLVVGGGYIGLELGTVYAALGSRVAVVEMTDGLLPGVDRDLVRPLQTRLEGTFESIALNTKVERLEARDEGIAVTVSGAGAASEQLFGRVLVAIGRRPNSAELGLEHTQVQLDSDGFVKVDGQQRTADPHIWAIGDVAGQPMLAHKATRQAKVAAEAIAGRAAAFDNQAIPAVVFTDPEIAWCGLTETQARADNRQIKVARFPWAASGRAATLGRTEGLTKLIFEPQTQRVLGMAVVGVGAGELIAEGVLAVETAAQARDLAESIHAHPTLSETVGEAAELFLGHATHLFRPKR